MSPQYYVARWVLSSVVSGIALLGLMVLTTGIMTDGSGLGLGTGMTIAVVVIGWATSFFGTFLVLTKLLAED